MVPCTSFNILCSINFLVVKIFDKVDYPESENDECLE